MQTVILTFITSGERTQRHRKLNPWYMMVTIHRKVFNWYNIFYQGSNFHSLIRILYVVISTNLFLGMDLLLIIYHTDLMLLNSEMEVNWLGTKPWYLLFLLQGSHWSLHRFSLEAYLKISHVCLSIHLSVPPPVRVWVYGPSRVISQKCLDQYLSSLVHWWCTMGVSCM